MITADALARELGCTLADLEDMLSHRALFAPASRISAEAADLLRRRWSKHTGVDYTVVIP